MNIWIDRIEERMMVKQISLKGHRSKLIHKELVSTLQDNAISLSTIKNWLRRFKSGDLSCGDEERPGRPLISMSPALQRFLKKFFFASVQVVAGPFTVDRATVKSLLDWELGLRKFTRRWMPDILSVEQPLRRVTESQSLLPILANLAENNFQGIITESGRNFQSESRSIESLHFRRLPKCLQVADGATNLGDCKQWGVLS
jgi:hypothetical protein